MMSSGGQKNRLLRDATDHLVFDDVQLVGRARQIALAAHANQKYGALAPGSFVQVHLPGVVSVLVEMLLAHRPDLIAAAWLHDVLEDTPQTMSRLFAQGMNSLVYVVDACTDGPGENRAARKERPYSMLPKCQDAILVKLADRIANVECAKFQRNHDILKMYWSEQSTFQERLRGRCLVTPGENVEAMWERLDRALL